MNLSLLAPLGTGIFYLGLALIIGGLLSLGAFTAPVLFKSFSRPEAGEAMTIIFRRYDTVLMIAVGLVILGEILRALPHGIPAFNFLVVARYVVLVALAGMTLYTTQVLDAKIAAMYDDPNFRKDLEVRTEFNEAHKLSEKLAKMELLAGVILLFLTPFVQPAKLP